MLIYVWYKTHYHCSTSGYFANSIMLVLNDARKVENYLASRSLLHSFLPSHQFVDCEMVSVNPSHYICKDCVSSAKAFEEIIFKSTGLDM